MVENDPKEVIMEALCTSLAPEDLRAREGTFQFFRSRLLPNAQMHEVTFKNRRGEPQRFLCLVVMQSGTWYMVSANTTRDVNHLLPGEEPHAELGGSNLCISGYVVDGGQEVTHVRLVSGNGTILEDTVQDGLVVFVPEQGIPWPIQVELYDHAGNLVSSHCWPYIHPAMRSQFYAVVRSHFPDPDSVPLFFPPSL